jgi:hypothetical protein
MDAPRPSEGLVHAQASATATTPVATGVVVPVAVLDFGDGHDTVLNRVTIQPVGDRGKRAHGALPARHVVQAEEGPIP